MKDIVWVNQQGAGMRVFMSLDSSTLSFQKGPGFEKQFSDPKLTVQGFTVGEMNRQHLHSLLDTWINDEILQPL